MTNNNYQDRENQNLSNQTDQGESGGELGGEAQVIERIKKSVSQTDKIYGQDLSWYLKIFGWPTFGLIILKILLEICYRRYFPLWPEGKIEWISTGLYCFIFLLIPPIAFLKFKANYYQALISNISGALISGIIISFFLLFWSGGLWMVFNLIGLPLLMIFESVILLTLVYGVVKIFKK